MGVLVRQNVQLSQLVGGRDASSPKWRASLRARHELEVRRAMTEWMRAMSLCSLASI